MAKKTLVNTKLSEVPISHKYLADAARRKVEDAAKAATKMGTAYFLQLEKYHLRHDPTRFLN